MKGICPCKAVEWWLNGGPASGIGNVRASAVFNCTVGERLRGDCDVSPLLLAQPPWAVRTYLVNGAVSGLEAPFDEAWRILLPDHLKRLQYRASLLPEGIFLSEGG